MGRSSWTLRPDRMYNIAVHIKVMGSPDDEFPLDEKTVHEAAKHINAKAIIAKRDDLFARLTDAAEIIEHLQENGWEINDAYCIWSNGNENGASTSYLTLCRQATAAHIFEALRPIGLMALKRRTFIEVVCDEVDSWAVELSEDGLTVCDNVDAIMDRYAQAQAAKVRPFRRRP